MHDHEMTPCSMHVLLRDLCCLMCKSDEESFMVDELMFLIFEFL